MDRTETAFSRNLSRSEFRIDVQDMVAWIQNVHGVLNTLDFDGISSKNEKIKALISGLRQRHPRDLFLILEYLDFHDYRVVSDSIRKDQLLCMIRYDDRMRNGVSTGVQTDQIPTEAAEVQTDPTPSSVIDTQTDPTPSSIIDTQTDPTPSSVIDTQTDPTPSSVIDTQTDRVETSSAESQAKPAVKDIKVTTTISNEGPWKDLVQKMEETELKYKNSRIVRVGGYENGSVLEIFHPTNPSVPRITKDISDMIPVYAHNCHLIDKDHVLIVGGKCTGDYLQHKKNETLSQATILNLKTFATTKGPDLPHPIEHAAATSLNGTLYVCGGVKSNYCSDATAACYKLTDNNQKWTPIGSLNTARLNHTVSAFDGHLYVFGGRNVKAESLKSVECYDPVSDSWIELPSRSQLNDCRHWTASLVHRGKIWISGGGANDSATRRTTEIFDPSAQTCTYGPRLNQQRSSHSTVEFGGKMYVIAGGHSAKTMEVLNDDTNEFEPADFQLEKDCWYGDFVVID